VADNGNPKGLRTTSFEYTQSISQTAAHAPGRTTVNENGRARSETGPSDFQVNAGRGMISIDKALMQNRPDEEHHDD
jgi:hypothetical protein